MRSRDDIPGDIARGRDRNGRSFSLSKAVKALFVAVIGLLAGMQIYDPSKRFIEAVVGLIVVGIVWNFSGIQALWFILLTYAFPFGFSWGTSTSLFIVIVFIIYIVHVSTGRYRFRGDSLLNIPIAIMVLASIISFYNQSGEPRIMRYAVLHTVNFFVIILLYYLIVNLVDDETRLRKTMGYFMGSTAIITFFAFLELLFPGRVILPNFIFSTHKISLIMKGIRIGGPFRDYELLAEFFAINIPIIVLMIVRSRRLLIRSMYLALLLSVLFMQFATIVRGAFISLIIGIIYLAWISRKDLNIVRSTGLAAAFVGTIVIIDAFMARYTVSGSLFKRLVGTTIERGFIPDTRVKSWTGAVERWLLHPFIGNGPGWDFTYNIEGRLWPHNAYLYYLNIFGVFGTAAFLVLLYRLAKTSLREIGQPISSASFPRSLMKVLHVSLIVLIIDMLKVDFQRNFLYQFFVWILFALISATRKVIDKSAAPADSDPGRSVDTSPVSRVNLRATSAGWIRRIR
jgi:hypothetical protein